MDNLFSSSKQVFITYAGILVMTIVGLSIINYFHIAYPVSVTTSVASSNQLSVVGEGKVDVIPDNASVEVGVVVNNVGSVEEAQKRINETNNKIIEAMKVLGIQKADIKTSSYSINPNYDYSSSGGVGGVKGYNGSVNITIKVKDISKLDDVISSATVAGANNVYGTNYNIENPEKYREEARNKAIANAKEQAQKLAGQLGIRLGRVVNIAESTPSSPPILYDRALTAEGMGGGTAPKADLQPGSQTITSVVTLYFEKR